MIRSLNNRSSTSPIQRHQQRTRPVICNAMQEDISFYSILDVSHTANKQEIRSAYLRAMKEMHPDKHSAHGSDDSTLNELCSLINEVYETLSDDDKRDAYDFVSGFSALSLNPFLDQASVRDQLFVDEVNCIGCGKCVRWAPGTFEIEASKYGRARVINQQGNTEEEVAIAIEVCPVDTIHYVSLQQLQLLEAALASMSLVDVFVMQRSGKSPGNVFQEASRRWEKRRGSNARGDGQGNSSAKIDWDFWSPSSKESADPEPEGKPSGSSRGDLKRISKLAAIASRAMRLWRMRKESERALISDGSPD
jgi:curved DNA-binding protein CbpA